MEERAMSSAGTLDQRHERMVQALWISDFVPTGSLGCALVGSVGTRAGAHG
jgi:hypothetical protein